ncbi:MarR family winged helix-turn-helix transcriptional regulator [Cellulosimicrobium cellulans]|uniref:MarR family winged helix-turn-helix transcriptional regulator n=1 Tax=Cellulosimicrobium cellulans TaxID=1710 RepID=UPI0036E4EC5F
MSAHGARRERLGAIMEHLATLGRELAGAKAGPFGDVRLSRSQLDALFLLAHAPGDLTPGRLAAHLGVTAGAVTQLVDGLRRHGLVETTPHPGDGRTRLLVLTPSARESVDAFEQEVVDRISARFDALDDDRLEQLELLLRAVQEER